MEVSYVSWVYEQIVQIRPETRVYMVMIQCCMVATAAGYLGHS